MAESAYQAYLIKLLRRMFDGCVILKNDSSYLQGVPDILILYKDRWAMLEIKADAKAKVQPNQEYYVNLMNEMSFAAFIYPSNEYEVLDALYAAFESGRTARLS